jgi:hypothetical protein
VRPGNHKIYDVVLGRSELSLEAYFHRLESKSEVKVVCMDRVRFSSAHLAHDDSARLQAHDVQRSRWHSIRELRSE